MVVVVAAVVVAVMLAVVVVVMVVAGATLTSGCTANDVMDWGSPPASALLATTRFRLVAAPE
jgi:hypothetical protein